MSSLDPHEDEIRYMVNVLGYSCGDVSKALKLHHGLTRGTSQANIYLFCSSKNIHKYDYARYSRTEIQEITSSAVSRTGPTYERKMLTGSLRAQGYNFGERVVRRSLVDVSPFYVTRRRIGVERLFNPHKYYAEYPGHKFHMDQNEKLTEFGVTEVIGSDGFSGKILAYAIMPIKNNLLIYDNVYRASIIKHGIFDQVRVDHGKEFYLCLYQQDKLQLYRNNTVRPSYIQTMSKQNHAAERLWVEINARVNYPLKHILRKMADDEEIHMQDPVTKFCVSKFSMACCDVGFQQVVASWNAHTIPQKGIPDNLFNQYLSSRSVHHSLLPIGEEAAFQYAQDGGRLTLPVQYGVDPLDNYPHLKIQREITFSNYFPSFHHIMYSLVNGDSSSFHDGLLTLVNLTTSLL